MKSMGSVWIADPDQDEGLVFSKPHIEGSGEASRQLGSFVVTSRYEASGAPVASFRVTFDNGDVAQGKRRSDSPGYVDLFRASS